MTEPIGKNCQCLYSFDQHYLLQALDKLIESSEEELKKTQADVAKETESKLVEGINLMIPYYKAYINDLKVVKERVAAMPKCD